GLDLARSLIISNRLIAHVPQEAMQSRSRGQTLLHRGPVQREAAVGRAGILPANPIVPSGIETGIGIGHRIVARIRAYDSTRGVDDLQLDRTGRVAGQRVIDDRPGGWILPCRQLRRPGSRLVGAHADSYSGHRSYDVRRSEGLGLRESPERTEVVENPESSSVRARDQIGAKARAVVLHLDIAH